MEHMEMTLNESLRRRCTEDAGCLLWTGSQTHNGLPVQHNRSLRRAVWESSRGPLARNQLVGVSCEHANCIEPTHLVLTTKSQASKKGNLPIDVRLRRAVALSITKRKTSKLSLQDVRDIRSSGEMSCDLARKYGVSDSAISKIRLNLAWRDASPFSGLGGRA